MNHTTRQGAWWAPLALTAAIALWTLDRREELAAPTRPASTADRGTLIVAMLALLVSAISLAFTLWDDREDDESANRTELRATLRDIALSRTRPRPAQGHQSTGRAAPEFVHAWSRANHAHDIARDLDWNISLQQKLGIAMALLEVNELDRAKEASQRALNAAKATSEKVEILKIQAEVLSITGECEESERVARQALELSEERDGYVVSLVEAHLAVAVSLSNCSKIEGSLTATSEAMKALTKAPKGVREGMQASAYDIASAAVWSDIDQDVEAALDSDEPATHLAEVFQARLDFVEEYTDLFGPLDSVWLQAQWASDIVEHDPAEALKLASEVEQDVKQSDAFRLKALWHKAIRRACATYDEHELCSRPPQRTGPSSPAESIPARPTPPP